MAVLAAKPAHGAVGHTVRHASLGVVLAALSFTIYVATVFSLPQVRDARYCCEQSGVAAAVSNVLYGARLGSLYSGVFDFFIHHFDEPLRQSLAKVRTPRTGLPIVPPGAWFPTTRDGNGIGYPLVATAAFRLFELHAWAPTLIMTILMALSALAFLRRFSGAYASVVILYFGGLTVMLFTPLIWDPSYAVEIPVGGIRYFSLVAVLPVFHVLLTLLDRRHGQTGPRGNAALLALQTAILLLAVLVRGSALPLSGAIVLVGVAIAWRRRRDPGRWRLVGREFAIMGLVSFALVAAIALSVPRQYLTEGRFGTVVWQRVTESLGINPAWPFAGVNAMFDCKRYVRQGLEPGPSDSNGGCIWMDYVTKHHIPLASLTDKTFGNLYETALRQAFFKIAARYPGEVLKTFVYYKPRYIIWSIGQSMRLNLGGNQAMAVRPTGPAVIAYSPAALGLLVGAVAVTVIYFACAAVSLSDIWRIAKVTLLSALFTIPSYIAAWAMPHTSADLLLYLFFAIGLAFGGIVLAARSFIAEFASRFHDSSGQTDDGKLHRAATITDRSDM